MGRFRAIHEGSEKASVQFDQLLQGAEYQVPKADDPYDHPDDNSSFRKPKPGMYLEISERLNIDLSRVFAIGDSIRDIKAALASGCKPLGVKTGNGSELSDEMPDLDEMVKNIPFPIKEIQTDNG